MKTTVTIKDLFAGEMLGGMNPEEWEQLSIDEKLDNRLSFIEDRARALSGMPYKPEMGLPASVWRITLNLADTAQKARTEPDGALKSWYALEAGRQLESVKTQLAACAFLDYQVPLKKRCSDGGFAKAIIAAEEAAYEHDRVVDLWRKLEREGKPERERCGIIARVVDYNQRTVSKIIKETKLRKEESC